jgi:hypothetical protein
MTHAVRRPVPRSLFPGHCFSVCGKPRSGSQPAFDRHQICFDGFNWSFCLIVPSLRPYGP